MRPALGRSARTRRFANVLLPLPLSPTIPSTWPRARENDTRSTARIVRRRAGKILLTASAVRMSGDGTPGLRQRGRARQRLALARAMTGNEPAISNRIEAWRHAAAEIERERAAQREPASGRGRRQRRRRSGNTRQSLVRITDIGEG